MMLIKEKNTVTNLINTGDFSCNKYLLNINQYHQMIAQGILTENEPIEFIKGELITMSPVGVKHAFIVRKLTALFSQKLGNNTIIDVQNPMTLDNHSQPEPDIMILKARDDFYQFELPKPEDILLVIEVSDSTLKFDRTVKIPLYSEAKIIESWLIDLNNECIEVYRNPNQEGYDQMQRYRQDDSLSMVAFPELKLTVKEIFGK